MKGNNLYQNHLEQLKAIYKDRDEREFKYEDKIAQRSKRIIAEILHNSGLCSTLDFEDKKIFVFSYGENNIHLQTLISKDENTDKYTILSCYPYFDYSSHYSFKIDKVEEWDNKLEATIYASTDDGFRVAFFASDYYTNKELYEEGKVLPVSLAALGMKVDGINNYASLYGKDFLSAIGEINENENAEDATMNFRDTSLDGYNDDDDENDNDEEDCDAEDDNIENNDNLIEEKDYKVKFGIACHPYFFSDNSRCPDEGDFLSPSYWLFEETFNDNPCVCYRIYLSNGSDKSFSLPLYFNENVHDKYAMDLTLSGHLWIVGKIDTARIKDHFEYDDFVADAYEISSYLKSRLSRSKISFSYQEGRNCLNDILIQLSYLEIKPGYVIDAYEYGTYMCMEYIPYCHIIETDIDYLNLKVKPKTELPPILDFFKVTFCEYGILQAWFIQHLSDFMPKFWHAQYGMVSFIFSEINYMCLCSNTKFPEQVLEQLKAIDCKELLPNIKMGTNSALMTYSFWSDWGGLIKQSVVVERKGETVCFGEPESTNLVKYDCGILF